MIIANHINIWFFKGGPILESASFSIHDHEKRWLLFSNGYFTPKSLLPPNPPFGGLKNSMIFRWFPEGVRGKTDENH